MYAVCKCYPRRTVIWNLLRRRVRFAAVPGLAAAGGEVCEGQSPSSSNRNRNGETDGGRDRNGKLAAGCTVVEINRELRIKFASANFQRRAAAPRASHECPFNGAHLYAQGFLRYIIERGTGDMKQAVARR